MADSITYNMDCLQAMRQMPDKCIDLVVTSPPYDDLRTYNGYSFDWKETIKEIYRVTKDGGVVVWIVADQTKDGSESGTSFRQALWAKECGFNLHDTMIWQKMSPFQHHNRYISDFEYMFVFSKGMPNTTNLIADRVNLCAGGGVASKTRGKDGKLFQTSGAKEKRVVKPIGVRTNIWDIPGERNNETDHPAVFPIALVSDHIRTWSKEGDTVMDPFLGSGTTRIAAYDLNRRFVGFEIDPDYFAKEEQRFEQHTAQMSLFVGG